VLCRGYVCLAAGLTRTKGQQPRHDVDSVCSVASHRSSSARGQPMASSASARPRIRPARVPSARLRTTSTCLSVNGRVTERASNEHADRVCFAQQRNRKPSVEEPRSADPDPLPQGRTGYAGATVVIVPFGPRYLSSPSSTYNIPPPAGFTDGGTDALAIAITPCPAPNWLVVLKPMLPPAASR
jgi:hypothetical protein